MRRTYRTSRRQAAKEIRRTRLEPRRDERAVAETANQQVGLDGARQSNPQTGINR